MNLFAWTQQRGAFPETYSQSCARVPHVTGGRFGIERCRSQPAAGRSASDELNGFVGTADNVAVVIRFIGRESRQPNRRGTVEGEWTVHVPGHTIGSGLEFIDDEAAGVVELEVGLWNPETEKGRRASLGRVERGVSGRLYLSIYGNDSHAAYPTVSRISLKHISDHPKIQQEDVEQMLDAASHPP